MHRWTMDFKVVFQNWVYRASLRKLIRPLEAKVRATNIKSLSHLITSSTILSLLFFLASGVYTVAHLLVIVPYTNNTQPPP
jgi:hypothetical protein